jgi:butyryl-CoA dehydrogenase
MSEVDSAILNYVRQFADDVLAPVAAEIDEQAVFVTRHLDSMAELGLFGINLPENWGGIGLRPEVMFEAVASIAGACGSTASMLTAHFLATDSILIGGEDDLRSRYLPDAASGKLLGAFGLTEPGAGSNPVDMTTRAERTADGYHLKGVKHFIRPGGAHHGPQGRACIRVVIRLSGARTKSNWGGRQRFPDSDEDPG